MKVGMFIADGVKINIGDSYDDMFKTLNECGIKYEIPYSETQGESQTLIIYMRSEGIELNVQSGSVVYLHASNAKLNTLFRVETGMTSADTLRYIKNKLVDLFQVESKAIRIDKFNSRNYSTTIQVGSDEIKVRIHLELSLSNELYVSTLKLLQESEKTRQR